jgi:RPA family protein
VGKLRPYEAGDRVNVAIEPESIVGADDGIREAWLTEAVEQTRARIAAFERGAARSAAAVEHYGNDIGPIEAAVAEAAAELGLEDDNPSNGQELPSR